MKFLIVGANFENKGAQSMLFITIDEIKKRVVNPEIYFASLNDINDNYSFKTLYYCNISKKIALEQNIFFKFYLIFYAFIRDVCKLILGKKKNLWKFLDLDRNIKNIDVIFDISGFNLGNQWSTEIQESYLDNIKIAKKYNIPIYLMPQSFGPFDKYDDRKKLYNDIKEYLRYPKIIFAREKAGYNELTKKLSLKNVKQSCDLVLQNKKVNLENIYKKINKRKLAYTKPNSVAIIPNAQCFNHGNSEKILNLYTEIIKHLLKNGKNVYIFRHSFEDLKVCKELKKLFINDKNVFLLEEDFSCLEYDEFVENFDFIICSRYHGIVHAYKRSIPAIILGWATKYKELAENVNQSKYMFNIANDNIDGENVLNIIDDMIINQEDNRKIIKGRVQEFQKHNCFEEVFKEINQK